ncbi:hypothetical protein ACSNOI_37495 [Actinomadura kijaniata]|uniref:hypothetical protein n=1 Tax=Actinomadura kijaniata TaxID=46161 RepID=UPI003F1CD515
MDDKAGGYDERTLIADGFERVHVELSRYDGPVKGLADVDGVPHYFERLGLDAFEDPYAVWPASEGAVAMEREQWAIYISWLRRYEAGEADGDGHPGAGGVDARYDELESLLAPHRRAPADARRLMARWRFDDGDERYRFDGIDQWVRWDPAG